MDKGGERSPCHNPAQKQFSYYGEGYVALWEGRIALTSHDLAQKNIKLLL